MQSIFLYSIKSLQDKLPITLPTLLITLQNSAMAIIPWGAIDYENPVAINIRKK